MFGYFKELLCCLWEIEKDLHTIASSMKVNDQKITSEQISKELSSFLENRQM